MTWNNTRTHACFLIMCGASSCSISEGRGWQAPRRDPASPPPPPHTSRPEAAALPLSGPGGRAGGCLPVARMRSRTPAAPIPQHLLEAAAAAWRSPPPSAAPWFRATPGARRPANPAQVRPRRHREPREGGGTGRSSSPHRVALPPSPPDGACAAAARRVYEGHCGLALFCCHIREHVLGFTSWNAGAG